MLKKSLFVAVAVAMLAGAAQAGQFKTHTWPTQFIAQEIATIRVIMDVGYWITVKDQANRTIKMQQVDVTRYSGCRDFSVENNFPLTLTASISSTGVVGGRYSTDFGPGVGSVDLDPGTNTVQICAYLRDADMRNQTPASNVHVANVKIWVVPRA